MSPVPLGVQFDIPLVRYPAFVFILFFLRIQPSANLCSPPRLPGKEVKEKKFKAALFLCVHKSMGKML